MGLQVGPKYPLLGANRSPLKGYLAGLERGLGFRVCSCKRRASTQGGRGRRAARKPHPRTTRSQASKGFCLSLGREAWGAAEHRGDAAGVQSARARTRANSIRRGTRGTAAIERAVGAQMQVGRDARKIVYPGTHAESTCCLAGSGGCGQTQCAGARGARGARQALSARRRRQRRCLEFGALGRRRKSGTKLWRVSTQAITLRQPFTLQAAAAAAPRQGVTHADV